MSILGSSVLYPLESEISQLTFSFEVEIEYPTNERDMIGNPIYAKLEKNYHQELSL
jgi:hypothetical protein